MSSASLTGTELQYVDAEGVDVVTTVGAVDGARLARALPVRRIRSHAGQRHRPGLFWSATTGGHVPYESRLELDRLWLADFDPSVSWISAQPMLLTGRDDDRLRRHVPDFLLTRVDLNPLVVDVKPEEFAAVPEVQAVFRWTSRVCSAAGWSYEVWTGGDPVVLANIRSVSVARRFMSEDALAESTLEQRWQVLAQVWSGRRAIDLNAPLEWSILMCPEPAS